MQLTTLLLRIFYFLKILTVLTTSIVLKFWLFCLEILAIKVYQVEDLDSSTYDSNHVTEVVSTPSF